MIKVTKIDWIGDRTNHLCSAVHNDVQVKIVAILTTNKNPDIQHEHLQTFAQILGEKADLLLYPSLKFKKEIDKIFDSLTTSIAVLSFIPGGIEMFGYRYEAKIDGGG